MLVVQRNFDGLGLKFKYDFRNCLAQLWMVFLPFPLLWRPSRNWVLPTSSSHHWSTCHWLVRWQIILDTETHLPDLEESLKKKVIHENLDEVNYNHTDTYYNFTKIIGFKCKNPIVQIILDTETRLPDLEESLKKNHI